MSNKNTKQKTQECIHDANEFGTFDNVTGVCWVCGRTATQVAKRAEKIAILDRLYDTDYTAPRTVRTVNYGEIELWNWIECQRQNAESDGNDLIAHVESSLSDESDELGVIFRAAGFSF